MDVPAETVAAVLDTVCIVAVTIELVIDDGADGIV